jgi:acyl dehydratase
MNRVTENDTTQKLALEDLVVGQVFTSGSFRLEAEQIKSFAAEYDPQPFHTDEELAKATFFAGLAASGWQTAAVTMKLLVQSTPILGGLIGAGAEISWPRATRPGDTLTVQTEVLDIRNLRTRPGYGIVTVRSTTLNQNSEPVQVIVSKLVVPKRV